ncbi:MULTISPECIES: hypothetical protein [unclassified Streptomyces]|uniref:hypothetical protein n=1 Tax=unclassified Streptomyces TaxID=2593676 RepID=UPI0011CEA14A|nr:MULTISPECIES: hypothetical protein [unclassified Streptomyces]TXS60345.1 hypothetical protein EAO69_41315 [Streptomyces sp. me109]
MSFRRPGALRGRMPLVVLTAGALALALGGGTPDSSGVAADGKPRCISTPRAYRAAWEARQVRCVSRSLFGTTHTRGSASPYPSG